MGFVKYNGMFAEKVIMAIIKSEILTPKKLTFKPRNYYYELLNLEREVKNENTKTIVQTG